MPTLKLWSFAKRGNSTAQPAASDAVEKSVTLKAAVSMLQPAFFVENATTPVWNYCQFEGRYYFINDITSVRNGLWELRCNIDVLATYKADILASSAFVVYDTAANTEIVDSRISVKTTASVSMAIGTLSNLSTLSLTGTVVVGIVGRSGVGYYVMSPAQADYLLNNVNDWLDTVDLEIPDVSGFADIPEAIGQLCVNLTAAARQLVATGKASDSIKSAVIFPFPASVFNTSNQLVIMGDYNTGRSAGKLESVILRDACTVNIPWQASDWRRNAPFHEIYVYIPLVGVIPISPSSVMGATALNITLAVDARTGEGMCRLAANRGGISGITEIGKYAFSCAGTYAIGASNVSPFQGLTSLLQAGSAVFSVGTNPNPAAQVAIGTRAIVGLMNNIQPQVTAIGTGGGAAVFDSIADVKCYTIYHDTNVLPDSVSAFMGTPTMAVKSLAGLTGYVETQNFSVSGSMTDTERNMVNNAMNGGVYIE